MKRLKTNIQIKLLQNKTKIRLMLAAFLLPAVLMMSFSGVPSAVADDLSELRDKSARLQAEIDKNNEEADRLKQRGDDLQAAVATLDNKIGQINNQIALYNNRIAELEIELKNAQDELERQKDLLRANMRALYKRAGASTVELLVASDSFSEFIDEQEYLERMKVSIQDSTQRVVALEQQVRAQRDEQKDLLKQEKVAKRSLDETRSSRASLLAKTRGEQSRYQDMVEKLKEQQREAQAALAAALSSGSYRVASVGPVSRGDIIGSVGNTGLSTGAHLHLEVRSGAQVVDPQPYIQTQPVKPTVVTQPYGNPDPIYSRGYHPGIDYSPGSGAIYAIDSGYLYRGCSDQMLGTRKNEYGYVAIVEHSAGHVSIYAHMSGGPAACNYNTYW